MKTYMSAALLILSLLGIAQEKNNKPLIETDKKWYNIGDQVKNVTIERIRNYPKKTAKISDFKGKLLILDFWNRGCSSCIAAFPKMEALQKQFGDKIQILLVCSNSEEQLKLLFKKNPNLKATKLPMPLGDTILNNLFPHSAVPYHVWISPDGKMIGMTDGGSTNSSNIKEFLNTGKVDLPFRKGLKSGDLLDVPIIEQLLSIQEPEKYLQGAVFIMKQTPYDRPEKFLSIPDIIRYKFFDYDTSKSIAKVIVEVKEVENILKYFPPKNADLKSKWNIHNRYKIQILPLSNKQKQSLGVQGEADYIKKYLQNYLLSFFGITYALENRKIKCWVVNRIGSTDSLKSKGKSEYMGVNESKDSYASEQMSGITFFRNVQLKGLFTRLNFKLRDELGQEHAPPILNETGLNEDLFKIDANIRLSSNLTLINKELGQYGLRINEEIREIPSLVIREL